MCYNTRVPERMESELSTRTDTHRPSVIDPSEYTYIGSYVNNPPCDGDGEMMIDEAMLVDYPQDHLDGATYEQILHPAASPDRAYPGTFHRCDHCGQTLNYVAVYRHNPTNQFITTGHDCADNTMGMDSRRSLDAKRQKDAMAAARANLKEEAERQKNLTETREDFPKAFAILNQYQGDNDFIKDVAGRLARYGRVARNDQTKVMTAIVKAHVRDQERARQIEEEEVEPCPTGNRITIEGVVLKTDVQENDFGTRHVMTVKDDRGFAVWGTEPSGLVVRVFEEDGETVNHIRGLDRGDRVRFVANIEQSRKSETFGFFKRPTKAEVLEAAPEPEPEPEPEETLEGKREQERKEIEKQMLTLQKAINLDAVTSSEALQNVKAIYRSSVTRYQEIGGDTKTIEISELEI